MDYYLNMSVYDLIAQVLGIGGLLASVFSFQSNTHKGIMRLQMIAGSFFTVNLFMLGAYTGALLNLVAVVRSIFLYHKEKPWAKKNFKVALGVFCVVFMVIAVSGAALWEGAVALIPGVAMVINTFSFAASRPKIVRATILISSPFWLIYDFINHSVGGYVNETLVIISAIVGLLRYDIKWKKK